MGATSMRTICWIAALVGCCAAALMATRGGDSAGLEQLPFRPEPGVLGKARPSLGTLMLTVTERPTLDRARVQAEWARAEGTEGCVVALSLPQGAYLVEGKKNVPALERAGTVEWLIGFPTGRALDAVVHLCGQTSSGEQACEALVRLVAE